MRRGSKALRTVLDRAHGGCAKHLDGAVKWVALLAVFVALVMLTLPVGLTQAAGPVTLEGTPTTAIGAANASSVSFTQVTGTANNRLLVVGVSWNSNSTERTLSSITFTPSGGSAQSLTPAVAHKHSTQNRDAALYYLVNPGSGVTGTITATFSGAVASGIVVGASNFAGVDQTTPIGVTNSADSGSNQNTTVTVGLTGLNGDELVIDNIFMGGSGSSQTLTAGSNQTQVWTNFSSNTRAADSTQQATSSSATMTSTAASSAYWDVVATAIKPAATGPTHTLTMAANPSGGGTTSPAAGGHSYSDGSIVNITATANVGYVFSNWTGGVANSTSASTTVTMDADKTVTANFTAQNYNLTMAVSPSGGGTTTPAVGITSEPANQVVNITATPASGYIFSGWTGTGVTDPSKASTTVTVDAAKLVTATFTAIPPGTAYQEGAVSTGSATTASSITFSHSTGTGANRLLLVGVSFNCGSTPVTISSVTFTPTSPSGSALPLSEVLTQLTDTSGSPRYSAVYKLVGPPSGATGDVTVTFSGALSNGGIAGAANFAGVDQTTPLGTPVGAASTNNTTGVVTVNLTGLGGNELIFDNVFNGASASGTTLTADASQTQLWSINGYAASTTSNTMAGASIKQASGTSATMSWTASSAGWWATVAVPIRPAAPGVTHTLTMAANPGGGGTTSPAAGGHTYAEGTVVDIGATPNIGYVFSNWSGGATGSTNPTTVTMSADKTVTANFTAQNYNLTMAVSPVGGGTTTPAVGAHSYGVNTVVDITATPASGYLFSGWTGTGVTDPSKATTTVTVDAAKLVTATFTAIPPGTAYIDGAVDTGTAAATTSGISFAHTTGTGGNRLMLVGISWNCGSTDATISSVTFTPSGLSALPLTEVMHQLTDTTSAPRYSAVWKLVGPPSGTAGTIDVTFSGPEANGAIAGAANFAGVDQTTPLGTVVGAASATNGTTAVTVNVTGLAGNELVFDNVFMGASAVGTTLTPDASQTQQWSIDGYTSSNNFNCMAGASTKQTTGTSVAMNWTGSASAWWATVAVPIRPAAPAAPDVTIDQAGTQADPTTVSPIHFTAVFSEPVTGFTGTDVHLSGTAGATTAAITDSGDHATYDVAVSGMTGTGTVTVSIPAGAAQDSGSLANTASTSTDPTVTFNLTHSVTLTQGWNLVAGAPGTSLPGDLWAWNGSQYVSTTSPVAWQGVWCKMGSGQSANVWTVQGPHTITLTQGWNLIGNCMATTANLDLSGLVAWTYSGGIFVSATSLAPGQGAWVKAASAGQQVTLTSAGG